MKVKPFTPDEVKKEQVSNIPDCVVQAFNELLVKNYDGFRAVITQKEVVAKIVSLSHGNLSREDIFDNHLLDVEELYRIHDWLVSYVKGTYVDTFDPYFEFKKRKGK